MTIKYLVPAHSGEYSAGARVTVRNAVLALDAIELALQQFDGKESRAVLELVDALRDAVDFARGEFTVNAISLLSDSAEMFEKDAAQRGRVPVSGAVAGNAWDRESAMRSRANDVKSQICRERLQTWRYSGAKSALAQSPRPRSPQHASPSASSQLGSRRRGDRSPYGVAGFRSPKPPRSPPCGRRFRRAPSQLRDILEGLVAADDERRLTLGLLALEPLVRDLVTLPYARLRERIGSAVVVNFHSVADGPDIPEKRAAIEAVRRHASNLLPRIEEINRTALPEGVEEPRAELGKLRAVFSCLLGWRAKTLSDSDYAARRSAASRDAFDVHPRWPIRIAGAHASEPAKPVRLRGR